MPERNPHDVQIPFLWSEEGELQLIQAICSALSHRRNRLRNAILLVEIDKLIRGQGQLFRGEWGISLSVRRLHEHVVDYWDSHSTTEAALNELASDRLLVIEEEAPESPRYRFVRLDVDGLKEGGIGVAWRPRR